MKKLSIAMMLLAGLVVTTSSCKKDETADKLKGTTWKQIGATVDPAMPFLGSDLWSLYAACVKDNLYTFNADGTGTEDEGATKCAASDPQTVDTYTWSLSDDGETLTISDSASVSQALNIDELSDETLKLSFSELDSIDNVTYKYTSTYQAQ
jgi:hypothetical protein